MLRDRGGVHVEDLLRRKDESKTYKLRAVGGLTARRAAKDGFDRVWDLDSWSRTNGIDLDTVSDIVIMTDTNNLDNELGSGGNIERLAHDLAEHLTEIGRRTTAWTDRWTF